MTKNTSPFFRVKYLLLLFICFTPTASVFCEPVVCSVKISIQGAVDRSDKSGGDNASVLQDGKSYRLVFESSLPGAMLVVDKVPEGTVFILDDPREPFLASDGINAFYFLLDDELATVGEFRVTLASPHPWEGKVVDTIKVVRECVACKNGYCAPGAADGENGCVDISFRLGATASGGSAGSLELFAMEPSSSLAMPDALTANLGEGVTVNYASGGAIESIVAPQVTVDVVVDSEYQYRLIVSDAASNVVRTTTIVNPDGAISNYRLHILEDADKDRVWLYEWSDVDSEWTLKEGSAVNDIQRITRKVDKAISATERVEGMYVLEGDGVTVVSRQETRYQAFPWGEERIEEVIDPSDLTLPYVGMDVTTYWFYYSDPVTDGDDYGKLRMQVSPMGAWTYYEYDNKARVVRTIEGIGDTPVPDLNTPVDVAVVAAASLVSEVDYLQIDLNDGDSEVENIERAIVLAQGVIEQSSYKIEWSNSVTIENQLCDVTWSIEPVSSDPEIGYGSTTAFLLALIGDVDYLGHDVSKRFRIGYVDAMSQPQDNKLKTKRVESGDGTISLYSYPSSDKKVVERGHADLGSGAVVRGTRSTSSVNSLGQTDAVLSERIGPDVNNGNWFVESLKRVTQSDVFGRPMATGYYFGSEAVAEWANASSGIASYTESKTYGCCGVQTRTDRYGLTTFYTYDDLGRTETVTQADGTSGELTLHYQYDAAGRVKSIEREGTSGAETIDGVSEYDSIGRVKSQQDAGDKFNFYTYQYVKPDGATYDPATDTGVFFQENRIYPHNQASGAVQVTWTDRHGRGVRSWLGEAGVGVVWDFSDPPAADETLVERSRQATDYDWSGRTISVRSYFNLAQLSLTDLGVEGVNYYVQPGATYDDRGRVLRAADSLGNIAATVYDANGREVESWVGTNASEATSEDPSGGAIGASAGNDMVQVSGTVYDNYGEMGESLRLKPNLTTLAAFSTSGGDAVATEYEEAYLAPGGELAGREFRIKSRDAASPWSINIYDEQGRETESLTYVNGSFSSLLAKTTQVYDDTLQGKGRLVASRVHEVASGGGGETGNYLETTYAYDDAGRQFKTGQNGSGISITLFDGVGRAERSLVVSDDNSTDAVADDVVASEIVYGYDTADNVIWIETYTRRHSAPGNGVGLLSLNTSWADIRYVATWYDNAHRVTHSVDYGDTPPPGN